MENVSIKSLVKTLFFVVFAVALLPTIFSSLASIVNCTGTCAVFLGIMPYAIMGGIAYSVIKYYGLI